ncbi:hypothetical protein NKG99_20550 [Mesorhizobium sp. M1409]|uniref:hypothetical protein n=1 Tax=Mesorhizobium sp. M1409 TaxID=2957100 RepID=UPI003338DA50
MPKSWREMTEAERAETVVQMKAGAQRAMDKLEADLTAHLFRRGCPYVVVINVDIVEPHLAGQHHE